MHITAYVDADIMRIRHCSLLKNSPLSSPSTQCCFYLFLSFLLKSNILRKSWKHQESQWVMNNLRCFNTFCSAPASVSTAASSRGQEHHLVLLFHKGTGHDARWWAFWSHRAGAARTDGPGRPTRLLPHCYNYAQINCLLGSHYVSINLKLTKAAQK